MPKWRKAARLYVACAAVPDLPPAGRRPGAPRQAQVFVQVEGLELATGRGSMPAPFASRAPSPRRLRFSIVATVFQVTFRLPSRLHPPTVPNMGRNITKANASALGKRSAQLRSQRQLQAERRAVDIALQAIAERALPLSKAHSVLHAWIDIIDERMHAAVAVGDDDMLCRLMSVRCQAFRCLYPMPKPGRGGRSQVMLDLPRPARVTHAPTITQGNNPFPAGPVPAPATPPPAAASQYQITPSLETDHVQGSGRQGSTEQGSNGVAGNPVTFGEESNSR
jgi:hypothetical protein